MTNNTSTQIAAQVASRYEGLTFAPLDRKADRSRNHTRAARKRSPRKTIR
jgi:hypothetical protein